jgi:hypothetical protein
MTHLGSERIALVKENTDKILKIAGATPVIVEKNSTNVLGILLASTL